MSNDVEPQGSDPSVEDLQDFFLSAEIRAQSAREHLAEIAENQRRQAEAVVTLVEHLREQLRASEAARIRLEDDNRRQSGRIADLEQQNRLVNANYSRLADSFSSFMRDVEDTRAHAVPLHKRIDAMLVQNDLGIGGRTPPPPSPRIAEFRDSVFHHQSPRHQQPSEHRHPPYDGGDGYGNEFTSYGHERHMPHPQHAYRNER